MGSIYQRCLRVMVYLGQDVVRPKSTDNRAYPARRDLDTESVSAIGLHQLLKMRYFQRVWVIQELILAPMVVIPVHDVELTARRPTASREGVTWHESDAPWMRYLCERFWNTRGAPSRRIHETKCLGCLASCLESLQGKD
jgi:hypothetical protein